MLKKSSLMLSATRKAKNASMSSRDNTWALPRTTITADIRMASSRFIIGPAAATSMWPVVIDNRRV